MSAEQATNSENVLEGQAFLLDLKQLDLCLRCQSCRRSNKGAHTEDERRVARDTCLRLLAVRHGRRDGEKTLSTSLHADDTEVPT